jgi:hypothetical protein
VEDVTLRELLVLLRRRWLITTAGALITALFTLYLASLPGVYSSKVQLTLLAPTGSESNPLTTGAYDLIGVAWAAADLVGSPRHGGVTIPGEANLTGMGVRDGYSVRLPNTGGQWSVAYDGPYIDIQAIGPSKERVSSYLSRAVSDLKAQLSSWQDSQGVHPADRIRTQLNPITPEISYSRGSLRRTWVVALVLGFGLTLTIAAAVDRRPYLRKTRWVARHGGRT